MHPHTVRTATRVFCAAAALLAAAGIVVLASASQVRGVAVSGDAFFFVKRQGISLAIGVAAAFVASRMRPAAWRTLAPWLAALTVLLLAVVLGLGPKIGGSRRWLHLGGFSFQPSELAKLSVALMFAWWIARVPRRMSRFREGLVIPGAGLGLVLGLVLREPDFGTTVVIGMLGWLVLFVAGAPPKTLVLGAVLASVALYGYLRLDPVRWARVDTWLHPERHPELARQTLESKKAFMAGGAAVNFGGGMQKHNYLPEVHTDFVFANVGEELGVGGTLGVAALFLTLTVCGSLISRGAADSFTSFLALGLTVAIALQALLNMCVVTGSLPTKGLALPFFSYGGSNLIVTLLECGILAGLGRAASRDSMAGELGRLDSA